MISNKIVIIERLALTGAMMYITLLYIISFFGYNSNNRIELQLTSKSQSISENFEYFEPKKLHHNLHFMSLSDCGFLMSAKNFNKSIDLDKLMIS